ncbi:TrmB family transcriptional regulator [Streptomyces sp. NPDC101225]|uniref:TrmB family transcriptional regulator n=1 Tax=Streptomyces sp. NPDC101225 TaxID=3366135 RepID=UPI0037F96E04
MTERLNVIERLVELGFTQYEARAYVGLLGQPPMTGYALANGTKIPQPKVYETLRRLEDKHVVVRINDEPARYVAVSPDHLMSQMEGDFGRRLADARLSLHKLHLDGADEGLRVMHSLGSFAASAAKANSLIEAASRHVYLSLHSDQLEDLAPALTRADSRGVRIDLLLFGRGEIPLRHGRLVRHASTSGIVYRHHQARHLALVADTDEALWALAPAGRDWQGIYAKDPLLSAVVKGYVRHDLYIQQIFSDLGEELEARYGPGMEALVSAPPESVEEADDTAASAEAALVRATRRSKSA